MSQVLECGPAVPPADQLDGQAAAQSCVDQLDVSVVIPTFRRDDSLKRLIELLIDQDLARERFEIVVVDDARSESTPELVAGLAAAHPEIALRLVPGRGRGPATARNLGWRAARGRIIAFIDDDAYPADDRWLKEGLSAFADVSVVALRGGVRVPVDDPPTDFQRNVKGLEQGSFVTCNAFVRRDALVRIGGFDERFLVPYREDSDLEFRLEETGTVLRDQRPLVIHPAPPGGFAVSLRLQRYSQYNALLYKKHPERYRREIQRLPPMHYYAIVASFMAALLALLGRHRHRAAAFALMWAALQGRFFVRRAHGTSHRPRHLLDLAYTSLLIPPLSLYWRLRGAVRFRVLFL